MVSFTFFSTLFTQLNELEHGSIGRRSGSGSGSGSMEKARYLEREIDR